MHDPVNSPSHYKALAECAQCGAEVETIQATERMNFNRGNAVKYLARAGRKGDARQEVEDLRKAAWYATREADQLQARLDAKDRRQDLLAEAKAAQGRRPYGPGGWVGPHPDPATVGLSPEQVRNLNMLRGTYLAAPYRSSPRPWWERLTVPR